MAKEELPQVPISQEQLQWLLGALYAYTEYLLRKVKPSAERQHALSVLSVLIPRMGAIIGQREPKPLWWTDVEVVVVKNGLAILVREVRAKQSKDKAMLLKRLQSLQDVLNHFRTTQD